MRFETTQVCLWICGFFYFCQAAISIKISNVLVSVAVISLVLYLKQIILLKICILYCLVSLNSILF